MKLFGIGCHNGWYSKLVSRYAFQQTNTSILPKLEEIRTAMISKFNPKQL